MKPLIYMDFQSGGQFSKIGTRRDIEKNGIVLREGMDFIFYQDDADEGGKPGYLFAEGAVHWDKNRNCWIGRFSEIRFARVESPEQLRDL